MKPHSLPNSSDSGTKKRNILFITCDQRMFHPVLEGLPQPALKRLAEKGVTFENHYISSAVCTPSRGVLYSGLAPQVTGIQEEMMFGWTPSLSPNNVSIGTAMKRLGYSTAYFGKFELDRFTVFPQLGANYSDALKRYGFDVWQPYGEVTGEQNQGYEMDGVIGAEGISWLRSNAGTLNDAGKPWFLVLSFINPHDIFFADVNPPNERLPDQQIQKAFKKGEIAKIPKDKIYSDKWTFDLWSTLDESLKSPGRPKAHREFHQGTEDVMGKIPTKHRDMWETYNNYYLNLLRENDGYIGQVLEALDELKLWDDTVVVFTSDHGELCGAHGGLRNKGPVAYEQNVHVPMIVVHPDGEKGQTTRALTSHIDVLPTLVGMTGAPREAVSEITKGLPGKDFSGVVKNPLSAPINEVRTGVLFNYVGLSTIDAKFYSNLFRNWSEDDGGFAMKPGDLADNQPDLTKRGFVSMIFDGRYKYARYYSPSQFNTPESIDDILAYNDIELYDLQEDPTEEKNLALPIILGKPLITEEEKKLTDLIRYMNGQLNELMAREVGVNDGQFLPRPVRPKGSVCC